MHHRPYSPVPSSSPSSSPHSSPHIPPAVPSFIDDETSKPTLVITDTHNVTSPSASPTILGLPLKYVALVTLAVQNAALSIVMHYSRVSTAKAYSPALAVLLNELLKGSISLVIAYWRILKSNNTSGRSLTSPRSSISILFNEIFSQDCWKLSIPALLYVIQNSLQFVAISNLPVASFQVIYQMKILTTAAFSVAMLGKRLTPVKWMSLLFLALGVGIVQIQTTSIGQVSSPKAVGSAHESAPRHIHRMNPLKGFGAVTFACFTSGLAGVYFERELKNSKADLWVRNVQLSLFSLIPAVLPVIWSAPHAGSDGLLSALFSNFGGWAWGTVSVQVFGGLVTAIVIKYSDNIMKGFATSLSIILSSLASVILFDFPITLPFLIGSSTVLAATWMYNQPPGKEPSLSIVVNGMSSKPSSPILGHFPLQRKTSGIPTALTSALGLSSRNGDAKDADLFADTLGTTRYQSSPYGSPFASRAPSREPSRPSTPALRNGATRSSS
jgi:UDP-sugar transporter A1/2/3